LVFDQVPRLSGSICGGFAVSLEPGALVKLSAKPDCILQLVNLDEVSGSAWVRPWPLLPSHSATFTVCLSDLDQAQPVG